MEDSKERIQVLSRTVILVDLNAPPELPFDGATIEPNTSSTCRIGSGWVRVEKREDGLYVDGRKVILYLSEQQKNGRMSGHELREELTGKPVLLLHPNILDALLEHPDFIPEDWKNDESENSRCIFFWAVIFRGSDGALCVRCIFFYSRRWHWNYRWLGYGWDDLLPAALLASYTTWPAPLGNLPAP